MRISWLHVRGFIIPVLDPFFRRSLSYATMKSVTEFGLLHWEMIDWGGIYRGRGVGGVDGGKRVGVGSQNKSSSHYLLNQLNESNK